ncbi:MAG: hypothetical protein JW821_03475 [Deltaproteobacteria bacterium]|nr:hypothetical protein [Deltaproteobacteria bacterium]
MKYLKKIILWGIIGGIVYFFMGYHIIFLGDTPKLLKKSNLTLNYTFFSAKNKSNESILDIDELRRDGIGDLLVEEGRLSEKELERLLNQYE